MKKILLAILLMSCSQVLLLSGPAGGRTDYSHLERISNISFDANCVNHIFQDGQGFLWLSTPRGLYRYDGYEVEKVSPAGIPFIAQVQCVSQIGDVLWLGTDGGVRLYDLRQNVFLEDPFPDMPKSVIWTLFYDNGLVWIGAEDALYRYSLSDAVLERISMGLADDHPGVSEIARSGDQLFVGTYNGLYVIELSDGVVRCMKPDNLERPFFVYALCASPHDDTIWLGTSDGLWQYRPEDNVFVRLPGMEKGLIVNDVVVDRDRAVIAGTDNGLYVWDGVSFQSYSHRIKDGSSLPNDDVESLLLDRDGNVWIGTHQGLVLASYGLAARFCSLDDLLGIPYGMAVQGLCLTGNNTLWLYGNNGIICQSPHGNTIYNMVSSQHSLPHNIVHSVYEDSQGVVWAATDGGLLFLNSSGDFQKVSILTDSYNADWCYDVLCDRENRLWVCTFSSGIFILDRDEALHGGPVAPLMCLYDEIQRAQVSRMRMDSQGCVWVLYFNRELDRIYPDGTVEPVRLPSYEGKTYFAIDLQIDADDFVWIGSSGTVLRLDYRTGEADEIVLNDRAADHDIGKVGIAPGAVWAASIDGQLWMIDKKTLNPVYVPATRRNYYSVAWNPENNTMLWGADDGLVQVRLPLEETQYPSRPPMITGTIVSGSRENDRTIRFSSLRYALASQEIYAYRLSDTDAWTSLQPGQHEVSFVNLPAGKYAFSVCLVSPSGEPMETACATCYFRVRPPFFLSWTAFLLYFLLFAAALFFIIYWVRMRTRYEQVRFERDLLKERSDEKFKFFTDVSHDLKTPLSLIKGPVGTLLSDQKDEKVRQQLKLIQENADKLNHLISRVLDIKRTETDTDAPILSVVDICSLISETAAQFREVSDRTETQLLLNLPSEPLYEITDSFRLSSILDNLLSNAFKFRNVNRADRFIKVTLQRQDAGIVLIVSDNGIGIPEEEIPYIFQRFYQSSLTRNHRDGSGIGLSIVDENVRKLGGTIHVTSEKNQGTTFTLHFPSQTGQKKDNLTAGAEMRKRNARILLVEDNQDLSAYLAGQLSDLGTVDVAGNGEAAIGMYRTKRPDLIVLDVMMPVMDGMTFLQTLHASYKQIPPVLMLTAKDDRKTMVEALALGVEDFLPKPFDTEILQLKVRHILQKGIWTDCAESGTEMSPRTRFFAEVNAIIEDNLDSSELNVSFLAERMNQSTRQLARNFKSMVGTTPTDYIRGVRMKKAAMMLSSGRFTVSEVMYSVGFTDHSYFARCFVNEFGCTPKQYCKNAVNE